MKRTLLTVCLTFIAALAMQAATLEVLKEDFENVPADSLPAGWTQEFVQLPVTQSANSRLYSWGVEEGDSLIYPAGCVSGTHRMKAANTTNQEMRFVTRLITPPINLTGVFRPQVVFSHAEPARASFSDTLRVYYFDSKTSVWKPLPDAEYTREANWRETILSLISPNASYRLAFEITESMGRGVVLDDIIVRATPTCQTVENITFAEIHAFDATILWDNFGAYNRFEVMVADEELDLQNIDENHVVANLTEDIYDPSVTVTGLEPETTYYVYIRSDCEENASGFTDWVGATFTTRKVAYLPYSEDFNESIKLTGNVGYGIPEGWTVGNNMSTTLPFVIRSNNASANALYSVDSTAYLGFVGELSTTPVAIPASQYVYAVTPEINDPSQSGVTSLQGLQVQFWLTASSFVSLGSKLYASELMVGTISDPEDIRTFHPLDTVHIAGTNLFRHVTVNMDNYTGTDKYVALVSRSRMANAMFVDNFTMSIPDAPVPGEVALGNVSSTGFTVTPLLNGAEAWDLVVSTEYSRTGDVSAASVLFSQNNITTSSSVVSNAALANQIVHVYVRAHKNRAVSDWSFAKTIRVPGIMPALTDSTSFVLSFEGGNDLQLSLLDQESRFPNSVRGTSTLYYPLGTIDTINTYPMCVSSAPNYSGHGSHMQFCGSDTWFTLPEATDLNTLKMVFRHSSLANLRGKLAIGVMTDPYDLSTFEQVAQFEAAGARYVRCLVSFDNYTGSGKYIAFRSLNAGSGRAASTNLIDEIIVSKLGTCREASNVAVTAHDSYADVSWNGGGMNTWIVALASDASMMNILSLDTVHTANIRFSNLEQEHTYYFYIQTVCDGQPLDLDDVCYMFTTPRGLPVREFFNNSSMPSGWTQSTQKASNIFSGAELTTSSSRPWSFSNSSDYVNAPMSGYVAYATLYNYSYDYSWLISPELYVDADPDKPLELVFDLGMATYTYSSSYSTYTYGEAAPNDWFMVAVSEDGGNTWLRENATVWNNTGTGDYVLNNLIWDGGEKVSIDFSKYIGKHIKFAFYLESTTSNHHDNLVIDNIILREGDDRCGGLSNLRAYAPNINAANITWQLAGQNPWPALVQLSTSANFASLIANDTIQGTSTTYSGLQPSTNYHVRARQLCTNDSEWKQASFRTPCTAITPEAFGWETFDDPEALGCWTVGLEVEKSPNDLPHRSQVNGFGNVLDMSKNSADTTASDGAYAIMPEFDLDDAVKDISHYQVIFKAATNSQADNNAAHLTVGIVSDPTDMSATWMEQASIELQYAEDSTEMKTYVVSFENYRGDVDGYIGHYVAFRAEGGTDHTNFVLIDDVTITDAEACHMVLDLAADSMTVDGGRLHWSGNGSEYEIGISATRINPDTCNTWLVHDTVAGTSLHVSGLEASSTYFAYIRAICEESAVGRWSSATNFKTMRGVPFLETFDDLHAHVTESDLLQIVGTHFAGDSVVATPQKVTGTSYSSGWLLADASTYASISGISGKMVKMDSYGTQSHWIVFPTLDMSSIESEVRFSAKVALCDYYSPYGTPDASTDDRVGMLVSLDGGTTWYRKDATFWTTNSTDGHPYDFGLDAKWISVDLTDYVGRSVTLAIMGESVSSSDGADNWLIVDSVRVEKRSSECLGVRNAVFELSGESSAVARWSIFGTPTEVVYELSDEPDFATLIEKDTTALDSVEFSNLETNHTYYLRLTQLGCNSGSVSLQVSTMSAIPFVENFDGTAIPVQWTVLKGNADAAIAGTALPQPDPTNKSAWSICTKNYGLAANHLEGSMSKLDAYTDVWLVSPDVMIPSGSEDVKLMFDMAFTARNKVTAPTDTLSEYEFRVLVSTDQGQSWSDQQWIFKNDASAYMRLKDVPATGTRIMLPMDAFTGHVVRFAFYKKNTGNTVNQVHIANVQLRELSEICDAPTDLQVSNVQFTTADLSWNGSDDKSFIIEYSMIADFTNAKRDTVFGTTTHTLTGLRTGTTYFVHVQQVCSQKSTSDFGEALSFTTEMGLPYIHALSSLDTWSRYQSPITDGLSGVRSNVSSSMFGWRVLTGTTILNADHIYCNTSSNNAYWVESPAINMTGVDAGTTVLLQIDLALTASTTKDSLPTGVDYATRNKFYVAVSTDDGVTYQTSDAWEFSSAATAAYPYADIPTGSGKTYRMDFSRFAGQSIRIALVSLAPVSACIHAARVNLDVATSACFGVSNMVFANTIDTAATFTLTPMDNAEHWQIAYGEQGKSLDQMRTVLIDSTTAQIGGLLLDSKYDVYVRSICAEGDTSQWAGPFSIETPLGLPYNVAFSGSFDGWSRYTGNPEDIFDGRDTLKPASTGWTEYNSSSAALGKPHIYCVQAASKANWLISPEINLMPQDGSKSIWLSMKAALTSTYSSAYAPTNVAGHTFRIAISEDNGDTWTEDNTILWSGDTLSTDYVYGDIPAGAGKTYHLQLTKYAGKKICIALIQGAATTGTSCIHIADFELAEYVVPCFGIENFVVTSSGNIAHCTITDENAASTAWQYVYGLSGFNPDNAAAVTVTGKTFDINNLPMSSTVDIYVRSICGSSDTTSWLGPQTVVTPNGIPFYQSFNASSIPSDWSGDWTAGKASYVWNVDHACVNIYGSSSVKKLVSPEINLYNVDNNVDLSFDMALTKWNTSSSPTSTAGQSFEVQISTDGGSEYEAIAVWSEDNDADYVYANIPTSGETYHVDLTEYIGESIKIRFCAIATISGADNDLHIRNVLVDTVSGGAGSCPKIRSMALLDTTFHSVTAIFRGKGLGEALVIEYKCIPEDGLFPAYPAMQSDTDVVVVDGLSSSSTYKMFARQQCPDSSWGVWAGPFYFNTVECNPVTGITVQEVTNTDAVVTLNSVSASAALGYQACLVAHGEPISNVQTFNSNTVHFVQNLPSNSIFDVYARKICEVGDTSDWRGPFSISTPLGVPYHESLNRTSTALPDGWETEYTSSYTQWKIGKENEAFGVPHAYTNNYSGTSWLKSPVVNTDGTHNYMNLTFDMALTDYGNSNPPDDATSDQSVTVYLSTNGGRTYDVVLAEFTPGGDPYDYFAIPTTGQHYIFDLSQYIGSSISVGFNCNASSGDNDLHIANFAIDTTTYSCDAVTHVEVYDVTINSASVSFRFPEDAPTGEALLQVATDESFNQLVVQETLYSNYYDMQGLSASTQYFVRVMNICSAGESQWSPVVNFHTDYGVRFLEDFETTQGFGAWTQSTTTTSNVFSSNELQEGGTKWSRKTQHAAIFPTAHVEMNTYGSNTGWLISPVIDLTNNVGQGLILSFELALSKWSSSDNVTPPDASTTQAFYVVVSEDEGETWFQKNSTSWLNAGGDYAYSALGIVPTEYLIDMSKYAGKRIKIGFCAESTATGGDNWIMFDNVDLNAVVSITYNDTICDYEDYDGHGFHYDADQLNLGENSYRIISENFDTITYLNIFVGTMAAEEVSATICEGEIFSGYGFDALEATVSGEYKRYVERAGQCDSILTLNLTVLPKAHIEIFDTLCDGSVYTFKGKSYYNDVILRDTLTSPATGCDSIVTYYITFSGDATTHSQIEAIICAGQRYRDALFSETEAGVYYETTSSVAGCDSVVTLILKVADEDGYFYDTINVEDLPYIYEDEVLIPAGSEAKDYVFPLESVNEDCHPELHVHVWMQTALPNVNALQLGLAPNPVQVGQSLHIVTDIPASNEFNATVFNAIGQEVYSISEFTTELPALYTSGIYMVRVQSGKQLFEGKVLVK